MYVYTRHYKPGLYLVLSLLFANNEVYRQEIVIGHATFLSGKMPKTFDMHVSNFIISRKSQDLDN